MGTDIILGCVTIIMAVLGGIVSAHAPQTKTPKVLYASAFIVLGIAALIFTIRLSRESERSATSTTLVLKELRTATDRIQSLETLNGEQSRQIVDLSNKAVKLAQNSISTATGGDSYCYLAILFQFTPPVPTCIH